MSGNRKPKYNYKLFNTRTGKYMSWNRKATWTTRSWVAARLHGEKIQEIEVHIFPVEAAIKQSAQSFLEEEAMADLERASKKLEKEKREQAIRDKEEFARLSAEIASREKKLQELRVRLKNC